MSSIHAGPVFLFLMVVLTQCQGKGSPSFRWLKVTYNVCKKVAPKHKATICWFLGNSESWEGRGRCILAFLSDLLSLLLSPGHKLVHWLVKDFSRSSVGLASEGVEPLSGFKVADQHDWFVIVFGNLGVWNGTMEWTDSSAKEKCQKCGDLWRFGRSSIISRYWET